MEQRKRKLAAALLASAASAALAAPLHAVTFTEPPSDAGQTLFTAQSTGTNNTTPLTAINGTISGSNGLDADIYIITITNTTTFSAVATSIAGIDTSLFLFNANGVPIIANDDQSNTNYQGAIPAGNSLLTTLTAGRYYLAISLSGNEPVNLNNQLLFTVDQPTTNVRGIAAGLNPTTFSSFDGATFVPEGGDYSIALTGAATAVPEPSTWAALALGGVASASAFLRRRRQQA